MSTSFDQAIQKIDDANRQDPTIEVFEGKEYPKELLYAIRMTEWLHRVANNPSEELQLAARGQHVCRWTSPRGQYADDRVGYLKWRTELKSFHAEKVGEILSECDYSSDVIERVKSLIRKEKLKTDPESQLLEDVVCLVFLESYFHDFAQKHDEEKLISIIQKTWRKMSDKGHMETLKMKLPDEDKALLQKALDAP